MRVTVTEEAVRRAFDAVKDDRSFDESRGLVERGLMPVEMLQAMTLRPEILRAFAGFGGSVYPGGLLERRVKELVIITASRANECQFCLNSHCDLVRIEDIVEQPLDVIDSGSVAMTPRENAAVELTLVAHADSNNVPAELDARLHELFSDAELVELAFLIGYINMLNLFNNLLRVRYHGEYGALETTVSPS
jgi:alkylhydroperoxidase family enzyme